MDQRQFGDVRRASEDLRIASLLRQVYELEDARDEEDLRWAERVAEPPVHAFQAAFALTREFFPELDDGVAALTAAAYGAVAAYRVPTPAAPEDTRRAMRGPFGEGGIRERLAWAIALRTADFQMLHWYLGPPGGDRTATWMSAVAHGQAAVEFIQTWNDALGDPETRERRYRPGWVAAAAAAWCTYQESRRRPVPAPADVLEFPLTEVLQ